MLDASREAIGYTAGRSRDDLATDTMLGRALVKCLEIVGEAASRVSQETRDRVESIPWVEIKGMRNRLIHACFDINADEVWGTVANDLPILVRALEAILDADEREK